MSAQGFQIKINNTYFQKIISLTTEYKYDVIISSLFTSYFFNINSTDSSLNDSSMLYLVFGKNSNNNNKNEIRKERLIWIDEILK